MVAIWEFSTWLTYASGEVFNCENSWTISKNPKIGNGGHFGILYMSGIYVRGSVAPGNMVLQSEIRSLNVKIAEISTKIEKLVMEYNKDGRHHSDTKNDRGIA